MYSLHENTRENGSRLVNFAVYKNMSIGSSKFNHKIIQKTTWKSPDGKTENKIDHLLIHKRHLSNVMDVRSYRVANIESDHYLVGIKLRARMSNATTSTLKKMKRINLEQLKIEDKAREFKEKVKLSIDECEGEGIQLLWQNCKSTLKQISQEVLGFNGRQIRNEWYDGECAEATKVKNDAYQQMLQKQRTSVDIYKARRREE
jgi:hypothetical protein